MMAAMDRMIPLEKACVLLGAHPNTVRAWEAKGRIRIVYTCGGKRRIPESFSGRLYGLCSHAKARALVAAVKEAVAP
jgi:excisionase family DNA binding protein